MSAVMTDEKLWEAEAVAEYIGKTVGWVYAQCRAGRMPHKRLGRSVRFRKSEIDAWLDTQTSGTMGVHTKRPEAL